VTCCHKSTQINTTNTRVPLWIVRISVNTTLIELLGQIYPKVRLTLNLINSKPLRLWRRHCTRSWVSFPARTTSCFYQLPLVNIKILVLVHTSAIYLYYSYSIFSFMYSTIPRCVAIALRSVPIIAYDYLPCHQLRLWLVASSSHWAELLSMLGERNPLFFHPRHNGTYSPSFIPTLKLEYMVMYPQWLYMIMYDSFTGRATYTWVFNLWHHTIGRAPTGAHRGLFIQHDQARDQGATRCIQQDTRRQT
jgi:hypothetical protein